VEIMDVVPFLRWGLSKSCYIDCELQKEEISHYKGTGSWFPKLPVFCDFLINDDYFARINSERQVLVVH
jgi:hypothetical protein